MEINPGRPRICALVANAKGARLYIRQKSEISLVSTLMSPQKSLKARDIVLWLEKELIKVRIDRLVLVAPAAFLGALHKAIQPQAYPPVMAEIKKNLLSGSEAALQAELKKILWF